jgi:hypothetical protein
MTHAGALAWVSAFAMILPGTMGCSDGEPTCDDRQEEARALLKSYSVCESDADCTVSGGSAECLTPFLCSVAVRRDADLEQLRDEAQDLSKSYTQHCTGCAIADCVDPSTLGAACENRVCALQIPNP